MKTLVPGASSEIRLQFDLYCEQLGLAVTPYAEVDDMAMLRLLARDVEGVTVVPEVVVQDEIETGRLCNYGTLDAVTESFTRSPRNAILICLLSIGCSTTSCDYRL